MSRRSRASRSAYERGAAVVEFALVVPILLVLALGIIQYGWYFFAMQAGTSATSDAVRRLSVGDCQNSSELNALLVSKLGSARATGTSVTATVTHTSAATGHAVVPSPGAVGGGVELRVQFRTADFNFPFVPVPDDGTVTRTVFARVEDTNATTGGCS